MGPMGQALYSHYGLKGGYGASKPGVKGVESHLVSQRCAGQSDVFPILDL